MMITDQNTLIHIFCQSMPRSGHHFLERLLKSYYQDNYDYCPFYHANCCMEQPCSRVAQNSINLFMQKSHDLELKDKININGDYKFIIQYRHPIPRLFSDFELGKKAVLRNRNTDSITYDHQQNIFNRYFKQSLDYYPKFYHKWIISNLGKDNFLILKYEYLKEETASAFKDIVEFLGDDFSLQRYQKCQEVIGVKVDFGVSEKYSQPVLKHNTFFDIELLKKYEKDIFDLCPGIQYESYHELND